MTDHTDSDFVDVKKIRPSTMVTGTSALVDEISIEKGLQDIFRAGNDALSYLNVARGIQKDHFHEVFQDDGGDAMQLMLENANAAVQTAWNLADDLARSLGVNVHAQQEETAEA
jgi:hypothetical protein